MNTLPAFGEELGTTLRHGLGDWRDTIIWPKQILSDLMARTVFYKGRGFDSELTDFPPEAFHESIEIAGLRPTPSDLAPTLGSPVFSSKDPSEEEELSRTNEAHDYLLRLEIRLRRFIDEAMTAEYGNDWPKHHLPNNLYDCWQKKKSAAELNGGPSMPLIAYADFTDYWTAPHV